MMKHCIRDFLALLVIGLIVPSLSFAALERWQWRDPLPQGNSIRGVTYANNTFVAVGDLGTVLTSSDGIMWTKRFSGIYQRLNSIAYGNNIFAAVGVSGTILTSPDGIRWTTRTTGVFNDFLDVAYGNNMFVAVGTSGVVNSVDGINWAAATWTSEDTPYKVFFYGNSFFALATYMGPGWIVYDPSAPPTIVTSPDGVAWSLISGSADPLLGAVRGNDSFVKFGPYDGSAHTTVRPIRRSIPLLRRDRLDKNIFKG